MAVILEESAIINVRQAHGLIIAPLTPKSPLVSESNFTAIYTDLCSRPRRLRIGKFLTLHKSVLTAMGDINPRESGEVNTSILVRLAQHPVENRIFPADDFYGSKAPPPKRFACFYVIKSRPFLHRTYLSGANLYRADLSEAYLGSAYLSGANLGAYLRKISWNEGTQWENMQWLESAKNTPPALRKQLGL